MPEIKRNFTGGKMNLDIDERLVPNGQYREAMNIQVSTSEDSDVATIQNILGNSKVKASAQDTILGPLPWYTGSDHFFKCIGSVSDEKNDAFYWYIRETPLQYNNTSGLSSAQAWDFLGGSHVAKDRQMILEHKDNSVTPVIVDHSHHDIMIGGGSGSFVGHNSGNGDIEIPQDLNGNSPAWGSLSVGDELSGFINLQTGVSFSERTYTILAKSTVVNAAGQLAYIVNIGSLTDDPGVLGSFVLGASGINSLTNTALVHVNKNLNLLNFPEKVLADGEIVTKMITGINIIDDMLFWTDDFSEPKKLNIPLSIQGTDPSGAIHSQFINASRNITVDAEEKHITVIKEAPTKAPILDMEAERAGNFQGTTITNFSGINTGDTISLDITTTGPTPLIYEEGDIIFLKQDLNSTGVNYPITDFDVRVIIESISGSVYVCSVLAVKPGISFGSINCAVDLDRSYKKLYSLKFPRFATRYKYEDGEYSSFSPFSEVAFSPGDYNYMPNEGFNLGMENKLRQVTIRNIIPSNVPDGVVQVDILYKESNSPTVYTVDEIKPSDTHWIDNNFLIQEETIKSVVPENQLLRSYDNVPKYALAQEVTGNRVVYGNYVQNYDLIDPTTGEAFRPSFNVMLKKRRDVPTKKSIKTLRNYQIGVVYTDKYNRQTPVLSDGSGVLSVSKLESDKINQIVVTTSHTPPEWATHRKFYIKETSSEYYNLSLDRYFDAEDGNVWLSFPSNDRNKLDLETTLFLKKKYNSNEAEKNFNKYKVLDIKNEAPEFIKTRRTIVGKIGNEDTNTFMPTAASTPFLPVPGNSEILIAFNSTINTTLENFDKKFNSTDAGVDPTIPLNGAQSPNSPIFIRITSKDATGNELSLKTDWYEIDSIIRVTAGDFYKLIMKKPFKSVDTSWTTISTAVAPFDDPTEMSTIDNNDIELVFEVGQDIVQNRSIFQGRFFAKIRKDLYIQEAIVEQGQFQDVSTLATADFGYLKDFNQESFDTLNLTAQDHDAAIDLFNNNGIPPTQFGSLQGTYPADWGPGDELPNGIPVPTEAYWSHEAWQEIQSKLDNKTVPSRWVIDEAFAAGEEPVWGSFGFDEGLETNNLLSFSGLFAGATASNTPESSTLYGGYNLKTSNPNSLAHNENPGWTFYLYSSGLTSLTFSNGLSHGSNTADYEYYSQGRGLDNTGIEKTIDLSYIGTGRMMTGANLAGGVQPMHEYFEEPYDPGIGAFTGYDTLYTPWSSRWTIYGSGGDIGDALDAEAKNFAVLLEQGNYLRFKNDPTQVVYKISKVQKFFKLNYADKLGGLDRLYPLSDPTNQGGNIASYEKNAHFNHRTTWRLTLEPTYPFNAGDNIGTDGAGGIGYDPLVGDNTNATDLENTSCPIEILTQNYIGGENDNEVDFPENPAIFETEPKEDDGLEIFHEASDALPINVFGNEAEVAPVGTIVVGPTYIDANGDPQIPLSTTNPVTIVNWIGNRVFLTAGFSAAYVPVNIVPGYNDKFYFVRPDGSYITGTLINIVGFTSMTIDFSVNSPVGLSWHNCYSFGNGVESNRIRDTFNSVFIDKGPRVSAVLEEEYKEERRKYGLIYSGLYNSTSGVNNLNQFIQAEKITKEINPNYGSIQKLHTRDSDLVTLCEDKVLKILANKDAVFNADGNTQLTATTNVLGQTIPFVGEYGISKNPESFASESYRAYFTDQVRGTVMRLSMDGLTPISDAGMKDWFRDRFALDLSDSFVLGSYDDRKNEYNVTIDKARMSVSYREDVKGWVSFKSFVPEHGISCANNYYTFLGGFAWKHHDPTQDRNTFYDYSLVPSSVNAIINEDPGVIKTFHTLNYEGSQSKVDQQLCASGIGCYDITDPLTGNVINSIPTGDYYNLQPDQPGWHVVDIVTDQEEGSLNEFIEKEGKWFNYIRGKTGAHVDEDTAAVLNGFDSGDNSFQGLGGLVSAGPIESYGCTDPNAFNFSSAATIDNGTCVPFIYGCLDINNAWYNAGANLDTTPTACQIPGCTDSNYLQFNPDANDDNGTCTTLIVYGCMDNTAFNYDSTANIPCCTACDGSDDNNCCIPTINGCTDPAAANFNALFNTDDGSCQYLGCTMDTAENYDATANTDDGTCIWTGCIDPGATNYGLTNGDPFPLQATGYTPSPGYGLVNNGACEGVICADQTSLSYVINNQVAAAVPCQFCCVYCGDPASHGFSLNLFNADQTSVPGGTDVDVEIDFNWGPSAAIQFQNGLDLGWGVSFRVLDSNGVQVYHHGNSGGSNHILGVSFSNFGTTPNTNPYNYTFTAPALPSGDYTVEVVYVSDPVIGGTGCNIIDQSNGISWGDPATSCDVDANGAPKPSSALCEWEVGTFTII